MRAAVLHGVGDIALEEGPDPAPAAREVLVRVASAGVCGSDVHHYEDRRIGEFIVRAPMVLGHEASGEVGALGGGCDVLHAGDRVAMEPRVPCGPMRAVPNGPVQPVSHTRRARFVPRRDPESIKPVVRREE